LAPKQEISEITASINNSNKLLLIQWFASLILSELLITQKKAILCRFKWKDWSYSKQIQIKLHTSKSLLANIHDIFIFSICASHLFIFSIYANCKQTLWANIYSASASHHNNLCEARATVRSPNCRWEVILGLGKGWTFYNFLIGWTNQNSSSCTVTFTIASYIVTKKIHRDYLADSMHHRRIHTAQQG